MIKLKQILNEQGPTPAPKPNFKPGQLTDPNFMADWNNYSLSDGAKQTRYKNFMKSQRDLIDDAAKDIERAERETHYGSLTKDRVFGEYYALKGWLASLARFVGTTGVLLPKNYIEYVSNEIELGNTPKSIEELWPYIKQTIFSKTVFDKNDPKKELSQSELTAIYNKNSLKISIAALEKAISKVKRND